MRQLAPFTIVFLNLGEQMEPWAPLKDRFCWGWSRGVPDSALLINSLMLMINAVAECLYSCAETHVLKPNPPRGWLKDGAFGRLLGHEDRAPMNGICALL